MSLLRLRVQLRDYFTAGLLALVPILLSIGAVWWIVGTVDRTLAPLIDAFLGWHLPGLGLLAALLAILAAGAFVSHAVGGRVLELIESLLLRLPAFKWVYGTVKQLTEAFSPDGRPAFHSVVLVEYPRPGVFSLGFATGTTSLSRRDAPSQELVSVYIPTNHLYIGDVILVPKAQVTATTLGVEEGVQIMLSAGAAIPANLAARAEKRS